jgi:hypothetical protein
MRHENGARTTVLLLLVVALLGPFTYTSDGVPPPEWCDAPYLLLKDGRCVETLSAAELLALATGFLLTMSAGVVTGAVQLGDWVQGTLFLLSPGLFMLPVLSTLLLLYWQGAPQRLRTFHTMTWGLSVLLGLLLAKTSTGLGAQLWGVWLYIGLAIAALVLEIFMRTVGYLDQDYE